MSLLRLLRLFWPRRSGPAKPPPAPVPMPRPAPPPGPAAVFHEPDGDMVATINAVRARFGLEPVYYSILAAQAAQVQSDWQARRDLIGHDGPPGLPYVEDRLRAAGVKFDRASETAAQGLLVYWPEGPTQGKLAFDYNLRIACEDWLTSPGHREILLRPDWTFAGAAMATAASGNIYYTAVFFRTAFYG